MANTLTNLIPTIYGAYDEVLREKVGFIPSVTIDGAATRVAKDQTLYSHVAPAQSVSAITPAMSIPAAADQTIGNKSLTISNFYETGFSWTGEEQYSVDQGPGFNMILKDQFAQAFRVMTNRIESDIATAVNLGASRAYGAAGTTPFASTLADPANLKKILDDNGAGEDRQLVIDTTAGAALRTLAQLTKVNEAGDSSLLRRGVLLDIHGFAIRESAQVVSTTAGAMASATSTSAAFTVGQTVIPLATAGTGVVAAGDIVTFANDTNKYVVSSVSFAGANPASGDSITLAAPGLRVAQGVATRAITVIATSRRNAAFCRSAVVLAARLPKVPAGGDLAVDRYVVTDPISNISMEVALYPGYRMNKYVISAAWGVSVFKNEGVALLLG